MSRPTLKLVVPIYNEELAIPERLGAGVDPERGALVGPCADPNLFAYQHLFELRVAE